MDARVEFPQVGRGARRRGDRVSGPWTSDRVTTIFTLALTFPLAAALYERQAALWLLLAISLLVSVGWTLAFTRLRGKDVNWHAVPTAIAFALLLPPDVPIWQAMLSLSFGLVFGEQVFGGRGYSFVNPSVAALAFQFFSFPGAGAGGNSGAVTAAVLPGALLLLTYGFISWRVLLGYAGGLVGCIAIAGGLAHLPDMVTAGLAIALIHLVCDPVSGAATNPGRWAYGMLVGALTVVLGHAGQGVGSTSSVIFAVLLGSVFAPLIDAVVVRLNIARRRRRQ